MNTLNNYKDIKYDIRYVSPPTHTHQRIYHALHTNTHIHIHIYTHTYTRAYTQHTYYTPTHIKVKEILQIL